MKNPFTITASALALVLAFLATTAASQAAVIEKANNTEPLNSPDSWVGGGVPGENDIAVWGMLAGAQTITNNFAVSGIAFISNSVNASIGGSDTLTLGKDGFYFYGLNCLVALAADQKWRFTNGGTVTLNNAVALNGHTLTLQAGGGKKELKADILGTGTFIIDGTNVEMINQGRRMSGADVVVKNTTLTLGRDVVSSFNNPVFNSLTLSVNGNININGSSKTNPRPFISGQIAVLSSGGTGGFPSFLISPYSTWRMIFNAGSFAGAPDTAALWVRGNQLGLSDPANSVPSSHNLTFTTPPTLAGAGDPGTPSVGIIYGMVASTNISDTAEISLVTYDTTNGVRWLDLDNEYTFEIVDGETAGNNVRIANVAGLEDSAVVTNNISQNTAVNSLSLVTSGAGANGGILIEAENDAALKIESGVLFTYQNVTSPQSDFSSAIDIHAPLDFNGRQGMVINARTTDASTSTGNGNGILRIYGPLTNDGGNGVVFTGANGTLTHILNSAPFAFTGPLIVSSGMVRFDGAADTVSTKLIVNGGTVHNRGNRIADTADIEINGGSLNQRGDDANSDSGSSETFNNLLMAGGSYNMGANGSSSGSTTFNNAHITGGTLTITKGHNAYSNGDIFLSEAGRITFSDTTDSYRGTLWMTNGTITITNTAFAFPFNAQYIPVTLGYANSATRNPSRIVLNAEVAPAIRFVGQPNNSNTAVINSNAGTRLGQIELAGEQVFDIGDGLASADLRVSAVIADHETMSGTLVKQGSGMLELAAANTYTGGTLVNYGGVLLNGGSVAGSVEVSSGAIFGGNGVARGYITLENNAGLALSIATPLVVEGDIIAGGKIEVTLLDAIPDGDEVYHTLATAASITGNFVLAPEIAQFAPKWAVKKVKNDTELRLYKNTGAFIIVR